MLSASNAEMVTHSFLTSDSFCTFFLRVWVYVNMLMCERFLSRMCVCVCVCVCVCSHWPIRTGGNE